ncbi:MAG: hypothetical protein QNJ40_00105 [Xanthomonadales bacterium]|nr:hypothetical protein [Xanthomonadales bacterium]
MSRCPPSNLDTAYQGRGQTVSAVNLDNDTPLGEVIFADGFES